MLNRAALDPTKSADYRTGALVLVGATLVLLAALGFQHIGGYAPCPLCLQQRYAYYAGLPLLFVALVAVAAERKGLAAAVFALVGLAFVANAGLGIYHSGVEWKLWAGPDTCATVQDLSTSAGGLLDRLGQSKAVRCDDASWRLLGLSFAGWNVVASLLLAFGSMVAAREAARG